MPVESQAESDRRNAIANMSYTDYLSNTEQVRKDVRLIMNKKIPSVAENYIPDLDQTVQKAFDDAEMHLIDVVSHLESTKKDIFSNLISNEHLDKAKPTPADIPVARIACPTASPKELLKTCKNGI